MINNQNIYLTQIMKWYGYIWRAKYVLNEYSDHYYFNWSFFLPIININNEFKHRYILEILTIIFQLSSNVLYLILGRCYQNGIPTGSSLPISLSIDSHKICVKKRNLIIHLDFNKPKIRKLYFVIFLINKIHQSH